MGLLQEWREYAYGVDINSAQGKAIWDKYFAQEKVIYEELWQIFDCCIRYSKRTC